MRIAKIKNRYIFNSENPHGNHSYAVYYDKNTRRYRVVPLTHLYVKDNTRFVQLKREQIMKVKFPSFETPSGVWNHYYDTSLSGKKIDLKNPDVIEVSSRHLPKEMSDKIKQFAKRRRISF